MSICCAAQILKSSNPQILKSHLGERHALPGFNPHVFPREAAGEREQGGQPERRRHVSPERRDDKRENRDGHGAAPEHPRERPANDRRRGQLVDSRST